MVFPELVDDPVGLVHMDIGQGYQLEGPYIFDLLGHCIVQGCQLAGEERLHPAVHQVHEHIPHDYEVQVGGFIIVVKHFREGADVPVYRSGPGLRAHCFQESRLAS